MTATDRKNTIENDCTDRTTFFSVLFPYSFYYYKTNDDDERSRNGGGGGSRMGRRSTLLSLFRSCCCCCCCNCRSFVCRRGDGRIIPSHPVPASRSVVVAAALSPLFCVDSEDVAAEPPSIPKVDVDVDVDVDVEPEAVAVAVAASKCRNPRLLTSVIRRLKR